MAPGDHNTANELTSMTDVNGTTTLAYDTLGRLTSRTRGAFAASYGYHYGSFLTSVETDFPDEADVVYEYGGDLKRRERTAGTDTTWYNWGAGYAVMGEEDGSGNLLRTYVGNLAHIDGASAASGTYSYYWHDHLGSTRTLYDGAKAETASFDYAPYGDPILHSHSAATTRLYTGHDWDPAAGLYFAPFRYYNPDLARWITRDPLGMVDGTNVYAYVSCVPTILRDSLGLCVSWGDFLDGLQTGMDLIGMIPVIGEPVDVINSGVSLVRGDLIGAGLGLASAIPGFGNAAGAVNAGRRGFNWLDKGTDGLYTVRGPSGNGGPIIRRGDKQLHYHADPPFHDKPNKNSPHIDLQPTKNAIPC